MPYKNLVKSISLINLVMVFTLISYYSCSNNDDEDNSVDPSYNYVGIWSLTELQMVIAQDINGDGQSSTNLVDELDCFFSNQTIKSDGTYTLNSMGFDMMPTSETTLDIFCTNLMDGSGTWEEEENGIRINSTSWVRNGNSIILNHVDPVFPDFSKVVYTKN